VVDYSQKKISSYDFLRPSKKQKAVKWNQSDEEKLYDALRVFGENAEMIHELVFSKETAR